MLYTEFLRLWDEAVKAVDARDWQGALSKLNQITEPTSRTLFLTASAHLALGQLEPAIQALDQTIAKDERLAVGFFQRAGAFMMASRLEEALNDCISALKHMRGNMVIDYKQLGLRYKLYSWQVLYNTAAVHSRLDQLDKARDILISASQEKGRGGRGGNMEVALDMISRGEVLPVLLVPEGQVFRPRKQDVEQLGERDFLGKPKVISSMIPNDDFGGFEPLRVQKPGYYEPKVDRVEDSRYMRLRTPYISGGPGQLTVPGGAMVFVFSDMERDGLATVIHDGQKGLVPTTLLDPVDVNKSKGRRNYKSIPSGIPLPPGLRPPTRPQNQPSPIASLQESPVRQAPPPSYASATHSPNSSTPLRMYTSTVDSPTELDPTSPQGAEAGSVVVKVHYRYTVALSVPLGTPYDELQERIAHKLGQPASHLRLRHRQHGSQVLKPLDGEEGLRALLEVAEAGRTTLWCQTEDRLDNRTILYQMVALYDYAADGPEDLEFSEGDSIDILSEVNEEWLEGHCAGYIGIFPSCFAYREEETPTTRGATFTGDGGGHVPPTF
ncbi:NADPH oxidase activator 1-like [Salvelinus fontinalis]|uniref:NADPH oxidase activator 1-like n=1 Tax=Salvelinus fontinalis TaxID=8038 RepID=UPI002485A81F|nr:NADPH oxidase activator 1-like [Salvelinus fontinalis]